MPLILTGTAASTTLDSSAGLTFSDSSNQSAAASPFGLKNRIINGDMVISQRNGTSSVTPTALTTYLLDRWRADISAASKFSVQQNAGSVTPPAGFINYAGITSLSSYTPAAGEYFSFLQPIEGFNVADLGWGTASAQTVTLSFWVRSSLTGTFSGSIANGNFNRSYPFTYSISSANTWTKISITIPGDTSGTWATNNGVGIFLIYSLGIGSSWGSSSPNTWNASGFYGAASTVSVVGTNGATFYITGVQLERNTTATPFEWIPYTTELQLCQRYCLKYCGNTVFEDVNCNLIGFNTTTAYGTIFTVVPMRSSPSVTSGTLRLTDQTNVPTVTSVVASGSSYSGPYNINVGANAASGVVQYRPYQLQANNSTSAFLILSAEL